MTKTSRFLGGGTSITSIMPFIGVDTEAIVIFTDGQIDSREMQRFVDSHKLRDIPVIVFLTYLDHGVTVTKLNTTVNMSVPECFMGISNNVLIAVNNHNDIRVLMAKGAYRAFESGETLDNNSVISFLSSLNIKDLVAMKTIKGLSATQVLVAGSSDPIDLNDVYANKEIPLELLAGFSHRTILAKLDLVQIDTILLAMLKKYAKPMNAEAVAYSHAVAKAAEELFDSMKTNDNDVIVRAREKYKLTLASKPTGIAGDGNKETIAEINKFREIIKEYTKNKTSIVLSSNRANRAAVAEANNVEDLETANGIKSLCPILFEESLPCFFVKAGNNNYDLTSDYAMGSPFSAAAWIQADLMPGLFGAVFVNDLYEHRGQRLTHPYTREPIRGIIPLVHNKALVLQYMANAFGNNRLMSHLVNVFLGTLVNMANTPMFAEHHDTIVNFLKEFTKVNKTAVDLMDSTEGLVPFNDALVNCLKDSGAVIINKTEAETKAIIALAEIVIPDFKFNKQTILNRAAFRTVFMRELANYKKNGISLSDIAILDTDGFYEKPIGGIVGLIRQLFWHNDNVYNNKSLTDAVNYSFRDKTYGQALASAYSDGTFHEGVLELALPEPETGIYFPEENVFAGKYPFPKNVCLYTGREFDSFKDLLAYNKDQWKPYNTNTMKHCKIAVVQNPNKTIPELARIAHGGIVRQCGKYAKHIYCRFVKKDIFEILNEIHDKREQIMNEGAF
jgi:hypothetical protein